MGKKAATQAHATVIDNKTKGMGSASSTTVPVFDLSKLTQRAQRQQDKAIPAWKQGRADALRGHYRT